MNAIKFHSEIKRENQIDISDTQKRWEITSQNWLRKQMPDEIDKGDASREFIIDPALWKQLGDVSRLKILDAGCGNGYLARQLAKKGAKVIGVDFSKQFIDYCKKREKEHSLGCKFYQGSLTNLHFLETESFDLIISNVVMVDI